jgi:hypothetical protein
MSNIRLPPTSRQMEATDESDGHVPRWRRMGHEAIGMLEDVGPDIKRGSGR